MHGCPWVVITGGGSGIGRALVHHYSRTHRVLTCGRRHDALLQTRQSAPQPDAVTTCSCDLALATGRQRLVECLPPDAPLALLVQNAAIGDPAPLAQLDIAHFEESLCVNVVAPLALAQAFLPHLRRGGGRILHLGTSVAFHPQSGTATYGITKMAFHRLYEQLNAEALGVPVGSLSPGMVDTEGVRDHVAKARALHLPHVRFFDEAFEKQWTTPVEELMTLVDELLAMDAATFARREWRFSEWRKERRAAAAYEAARRGRVMTYGEWASARTPSFRKTSVGAAAAIALTLALVISMRARRPLVAVRCGG